MKLRKTGLWLLAALVIMVLCTVGFAFAEGLTDPYGFTFTPPENLDAVPRGRMLEVTVNAENPLVPYENENVVELMILDKWGEICGDPVQKKCVVFPCTLQLPATMEYDEDMREYILVVRACGGTGYKWVTDEYPFMLTDGYLIHFHSNDQMDEDFFQPAESGTVQLVSKPFTASGRHIKGWVPFDTRGNWDWVGHIYAEDGAEITEITGDLDLYAIWEINENWLYVDTVDMTYPDAVVNLTEGGNVSLRIWRGRTEEAYDNVRSTRFTLGGDNGIGLHAESDEDYTFFGWYSAERLNDENWMLMPVELQEKYDYYYFGVSGDKEERKVCAAFVRSENFGTAAFTVPSSLEKIEANAFEGISAKSVYVPDTCIEIGAGAFSDCENLVKIRLPKVCDIDDNSTFAGSGRVVIYAPAGGGTQDWAEDNGIVFHEEK